MKKKEAGLSEICNEQHFGEKWRIVFKQRGCSLSLKTAGPIVMYKTNHGRPHHLIRSNKVLSIMQFSH